MQNSREDFNQRTVFGTAPSRQNAGIRKGFGRQDFVRNAPSRQHAKGREDFNRQGIVQYCAFEASSFV